ncbi:MAG: tryptophan--tRNA ligase [Psittacicella sp.]
MKKENIIFSGIQPSGELTLGNYLGALRNWIEMQENNNCTFCIVDLHAITVKQDPKLLKSRVLDILSIYLASGLDPNKCTIFLQSQVSEHSELAWILSCNTYFGEMSRMTQFKDKSTKHSNNINVGLFTYPILMASDILLYSASQVPVGIDQKQHLEITRDIATRFNKNYGDIFKVPEPYISTTGAKIMSLADPSKKMSKSDDNENSLIRFLDDRKTIVKKLKKAVTDSDNPAKIYFNLEEKPGVSNLLNIAASISNKSVKELSDHFKEYTQYGKFKEEIANIIADHLEPIQERYYKIRQNESYLYSVLEDGAKKAKFIAQNKLNEVKKSLGLGF